LSINEFVKFQQQVVDLAGKKEFHSTLVLIEEAKAKFPLKVDRLGHWKAQIYCILGENDKAIKELNEVVKNGLWWNPAILQHDNELAPLRELEAFQKILNICEEKYEHEKQTSKSKVDIIGNSDSTTVITAIHWRGSNNKDFMEQIGTSEVLDSYLLQFVQSSQLFSYNCYSWDDLEVAKRDVKNTVQLLEQVESKKGKTNILLGASQGGELAITLCLDEGLNIDKAILVVPAIKDLEALEEKLIKMDKPFNCVIITGDEDPFYDNLCKAVELFKKYNINYHLYVEKGLGHELPINFELQIHKAVETLK
jgi:predicted esterase/molybdopterin converting factor small subunit